MSAGDPLALATLATLALIVAILAAHYGRRLGCAEGELTILRQVLASHRQRCAASTSSGTRPISPPPPPTPVRPAGMPMAEWRRRQGLEPRDEEDEGEGDE